MEAFDLRPSAKIKMAAIELLKVIYACERDIFKTVSPIDFNVEICFHII